jgi:hypothetical protein
MVADLVDQHMAHDVAQGLGVFGPIVQNRAALEEDHGRMRRMRAAVAVREIGTRK